MSVPSEKQEKQHYKQFTFPQIDEYIEKYSYSQATWKDIPKWISAVSLIAKYFINIGTDFWVMIDFWQNGQQQQQAISYTVFFALGFILMVYSVREAYYIVKSKSVSEVFLNNDARRWYTLQFKYWFFYNDAEKTLGRWDKITIFIYLTLKEWKMLLLVQMPQMWITVSPYLCKGDSSCGGPNPAQSTKISVLSLQLTVLMFAFILYPMMRCCGAAHARGNLSLREYVAFLIDKEISALLKKFLKDKHPDLYQKFESEIEGKPQKPTAGSSSTHASPTSSPNESPAQSTIDMPIDVSSPQGISDLASNFQQNISVTDLTS